MASRQLITISPGGALEGLQFKPGKGLDLRRFGRAKIERTSDIRFDDSRQLWHIVFLHGSLAGQSATYGVAKVVGARFDNPVIAEAMRTLPETECIFLGDYDDAVAAEIEILQAARKAGLAELIAPH